MHEFANPHFPNDNGNGPALAPKPHRRWPRVGAEASSSMAPRWRRGLIVNGPALAPKPHRPWPRVGAEASELLRDAQALNSLLRPTSDQQ